MRVYAPQCVADLDSNPKFDCALRTQNATRSMGQQVLVPDVVLRPSTTRSWTTPTLAQAL